MIDEQTDEDMCEWHAWRVRRNSCMTDDAWMMSKETAAAVVEGQQQAGGGLPHQYSQNCALMELKRSAWASAL